MALEPSLSRTRSHQVHSQNPLMKMVVKVDCSNYVSRRKKGPMKREKGLIRSPMKCIRTHRMAKEICVKTTGDILSKRCSAHGVEITFLSCAMD